MASGLTIQLHGFKELEHRLAKMPTRIQNKCIRKAFRSTAAKIAKRVKAATPRDTGLARRHVKTRVKVRKGGGWASVKYIQGTGRIMRFYDRGTRRQIARPFYKQATADYEREAVAALMTTLREAVEKEEAGL